MNDLEKYVYKTELHCHTSPASVCADFSVEEIFKLYSEAGYHSVAITNHFQYGAKIKNSDKIKAILKDFSEAEKLSKKYSINPIFALELRFNEGNANDYLFYGVCTKEMEKIAEYLDGSLENFYKNYRSDNNILIQAHPFRDRNFPANPEFVDGIEVFNLHPGHNSRIGFAAKHAKMYGKIITAGTDFHHEGHHCLCAMLTKQPITDSFELAGALKSGDYLLSISGIIISPNTYI